ncbi:MAG: xanthine phosphoribosyltransferase, partial [Oscillospiraceae bacterium]|nr:xanthine phosphoribosyltransferase [Oscillospiraceae bacterium]MBQ6698279.1 xanthine phosphoribosyltransferase [Oscillospiraceae bacterium]
DVYTSRVHSFTKDKYYDVMVSKDFIHAGDRVLIIDDFLAKGAALIGLCDIINQAGATVVGAGIAIEKAFQDGGKKVRDMGIRVESLARVASMSPGGGVVFAE